MKNFNNKIRSKLNEVIKGSRKEFWIYGLVLPWLFFGFLIFAIPAIKGDDRDFVVSSILILMSFFIPLILIWNIYAQTCRLTNAGFSKLWFLINFIPFIGIPIGLAICMLPHKPKIKNS